MSDTQTALHPFWRSRNRQCLTVRAPVNRVVDRGGSIAADHSTWDKRRGATRRRSTPDRWFGCGKGFRSDLGG
jgi:hypothetical protein